MTENKFQLDVERPELLDDWDQRWVMSTLTRDMATNRMTIAQVAEKDQVNALFTGLSRPLYFSASVKIAQSSWRWMKLILKF